MRGCELSRIRSGAFAVLKWGAVWVAFIAFPVLISGQNLIPVLRLEEPLEEDVELGDSLYFFAEAKNARKALQPLIPEEQQPETGGIWSAIRVVNATDKTQRATLRFCNYVEAVRLFVFQDSSLIDRQFNSYSMWGSKMHLNSTNQYLWVSIEPGEEQTLFFQVDYQESTPEAHYRHLSILPVVPEVNRMINQFSLQAFYAGLLILLSIVAGFMYWIFQERAFVFFAGMMLSAALYFADRNGLTHLLGDFPHPVDPFPLMIFAISCVVGFTSLFAINFLQLSREMPTYYRIYAILSVCTAIAPYLFAFLFEEVQTARVLWDLLLACWTLLSILPVGWLAWRGQSAARTLIWPFGLLFLGSALFLLGNMKVLPNWGFVRYGFQVGLLLFSGFLFFGLFDRVSSLRKKKQQFEELNALKTRFFTNLSHEFRTPLTLMMGPLQQLLQNNPGPEERQLLEIAFRNANNQLHLVNELLELSRLEAGRLTLQASKQDIVPFVRGLTFAFESLAREKQIDLSVSNEVPSFELYYEAGKLEKVLNNLLFNALKFTPSGGNVTVDLREAGQEFCISVSDSGPGIPEAQQGKVFDRFFQVSASPEVGTGVGLALARELVRLHHGRIVLESREGRGAAFKVFLPLGRGHLRAEEVVADPLKPTPRSTALAPVPVQVKAKGTSTPAATVLLIEDNEEVRAFIRQRLSSDFQVEEAEDGRVGITKAIAMMPDLIVSDVMMPHKNGYDVCAALKAEVRTSHIPIILLTAKAEQEEKLQGLRTGADDYLAKPFDAEELRVRIHNLIQLRQQLRQRFATAVELKPEEVAVNSIDQDFLERTLLIVQGYLGDEQFSVEVLAREVGMSRPHLNRKLRALVNQSTNQFIQSVRLQRAADLLRQQSGTVAEIAFQTGFSSTAYFIKCFKDKYGETPGSFAKNQG
jgi:signal transduction histidine kinase/DNA-binding response OmpR family regulator